MNQRITNLYNCGCDSCAEVQLGFNRKSDSFKSVLNDVEKAYKELHQKGKYNPSDIKKTDAYKNLINSTNSILSEVLEDNFIPSTMKRALENDIFLFSGLKTHAQLFEASRLLLDENKQIKPFNKFYQDVTNIRKNYNELYLEAEYIFATSSAQSAAQWADIEADNGKYNLQYRTAKDEKVRNSHRVLDEITLPADDAFWDKYSPPNGWRCRCNRVQVLKDKYEVSDSKKAIEKGESATTQIGKDGKNRFEIFRFNPGKDKVIFPPKHPYQKLAGASTIKEIVKSGTLNFSTVKTFKNGGSVSVHNLVDKTGSDYQAVLDSATHFAQLGSKAEILPKFNGDPDKNDYKSVFSDLMGTKYERKCPDFRVDGQFYEHEGFIGKNPKHALKNMLNRGLKQSSKIVIEDCGVTESYLKRNIKDRIFIEKQTIDEVWMKTGKDLKLIYKNAKTP